MIYTSYFGQIRNFPKNFEPICISRWKPKWYNGKIYLALAPSKQLLSWWRASDKNAVDELNYKKNFTVMLNKLSPEKTVHSIYAIAEGKTPVLVCFEKDGFCHRHLVAAWLKENGFDCEEWGKEKI